MRFTLREIKASCARISASMEKKFKPGMFKPKESKQEIKIKEIFNKLVRNIQDQESPIEVYMKFYQFYKHYATFYPHLRSFLIYSLKIELALLVRVDIPEFRPGKYGGNMAIIEQLQKVFEKRVNFMRQGIKDYYERDLPDYIEHDLADLMEKEYQLENPGAISLKILSK